MYRFIFFYKWFWILSYPLIMNGFLFTGRKINQEEKELKHLKSHFMNSQTKKENKVNMNWMTRQIFLLKWKRMAILLSW